MLPSSDCGRNSDQIFTAVGVQIAVQDYGIVLIYVSLMDRESGRLRGGGEREKQQQTENRCRGKNVEAEVEYAGSDCVRHGVLLVAMLPVMGEVSFPSSVLT